MPTTTKPVAKTHTEQLTVWRSPDDVLETLAGEVPYKVWLQMEVTRMQADNPERRFVVETRKDGAEIALFETLR